MDILPGQEKRVKLYLSSEKACKEFAKMFIEEGFCINVGKDKLPNKSKNQFYLEYWKE